MFALRSPRTQMYFFGGSWLISNSNSSSQLQEGLVPTRTLVALRKQELPGPHGLASFSSLAKEDAIWRHSPGVFFPSHARALSQTPIFDRKCFLSLGMKESGISLVSILPLDYFGKLLTALWPMCLFSKNEGSRLNSSKIWDTEIPRMRPRA